MARMRAIKQVKSQARLPILIKSNYSHKETIKMKAVKISSLHHKAQAKYSKIYSKRADTPLKHKFKD
jgi:hypothetical protein